MRDRTTEWLLMRKRVGKFLKDHLSIRQPYRQCKGMLRFYEDRIEELKLRPSFLSESPRVQRLQLIEIRAQDPLRA